MAITYSVNATAVTGGILAYWPPIQTGAGNDGTPQYNTIFYRHIWTIDKLEMSDYLFLQGLRGTSITGLQTTDKDTPNSQGSYTVGRVMTVTGQHRARQMLNVQVEFLVDVT